MQPPVRIYSTTHEGLVHEKNEDSYAVVQTDEGGLLLLVCDGMGGMGRGDVASALAVDELTQRIVPGTGFPTERMRKAIREADQEVRNQLCNSAQGMPGATAVMVYLLDGQGHVAWVGDSRAYLVRDGRVVERTRDHKLVDELVQAGQLTPEEAKDSALAHVITQALGGRPPGDRPVKGSTLGHPWKMANGDRIVLCSDGVCDLVEDQELADLVRGRDPEEGARKLQRLALERGGHDNITAIVASWDGNDYVEDDVATPAFVGRERFPDRDLRDSVPAASALDEDRRGTVTEELDPGWRPGDDEDTGVTSQAIFGIPEAVAGEPNPSATATADVVADQVMPSPQPASNISQSAPEEETTLDWMLYVAAAVAVLVVIGLVLGLR